MYFKGPTGAYTYINATDKLGTSDCLDSDGDVYRNSPYTVGSDNDQDGHTDTAGATQCVGGDTTVSGRTYYQDTSAAYTWLRDSQKLGTSDCCDTDSDAYSGQTSYFTTETNCGGSYPYDYNCDNVDTKRWSAVNGGCSGPCAGEPPICIDEGNSVAGWSGATAPACGVYGASYYTGGETSCDDKGFPAAPCDEWVVVCPKEAHTQECR